MPRPPSRRHRRQYQLLLLLQEAFPSERLSLQQQQHSNRSPLSLKRWHVLVLCGISAATALLLGLASNDPYYEPAVSLEFLVTADGKESSSAAAASSSSSSFDTKQQKQEKPQRSSKENIPPPLLSPPPPAKSVTEPANRPPPPPAATDSYAQQETEEKGIVKQPPPPMYVTAETEPSNRKKESPPATNDSDSQQEQPKRSYKGNELPRPPPENLPPPPAAATTPELDADCPFRDSPLYRKVYVYPTWGDEDWKGDILSEAGRNLTHLPKWPWIDIDASARAENESHYDILSQHIQYTTEHMIRDIITHPRSCLRTRDPEAADLFYVPYMSSTEHLLGKSRAEPDNSQSRWGNAIRDILEQQVYATWENTWGLTSKYWRRRDGSDHILVFSEPLHGLWHPKSRRGHFHFLHSQYQTHPPIVVSVELSTTFVRQYGPCATKNILVPYPNTNGMWYNGMYQKKADAAMADANFSLAVHSTAALAAERGAPAGRPVAQFYKAGNHGECRTLRTAMRQDYQSCSASHVALEFFLGRNQHYSAAMRTATFCPCPGGDSPSAKRMFDAIIAGCIPVILSHDFVWPFTSEFDPETTWDPSDFSIRLNASNYEPSALDPKTCQPVAPNRTIGLQAYLESVSAETIADLRRGLEKASARYSWYPLNDPTIPENPLKEGVLPTGGLAHAVVASLADRAAGVRWPACRAHLTKLEEQYGDRKKIPEARRFKC